MPTGYTAPVADGKITDLRTFAIECARAFGACISLRDAGNVEVPERFEPDTSYHDTHIAAAQKALDEIPTLSDSECDTGADAEFDAALESHLSYLADQRAKKRRYTDMIAKVESWQVPQECAELKSFMLSQLHDSLKFDCGGSYQPKDPVRATGAEWRAAQLRKASEDLVYHKNERAKEIERVEGRNKWLATLRASLPSA